MIGNIARVTTEELNSFRSDSSLLEQKLDSENIYEAKWFLDIDKAWEGIQFVLTGTGMAEFDLSPGVLERALFSGQLLDESQNLGYGPAHFLDSIQVLETNAELQKLDNTEIVSRIKIDEMVSANIYPDIWNEPESVSFLVESIEELKTFYAIAASEEQAIIFFIS